MFNVQIKIGDYEAIHSNSYMIYIQHFYIKQE